MAEPTLTQVFGAGATQDATTVTFLKSDIGVTASSATAEAILAGINVKASGFLTETNFGTNIDQSIYVAPGFSSFTTRNDDPYRLDQLTINLAKLDDGATLDPNDY